MLRTAFRLFFFVTLFLFFRFAQADVLTLLLSALAGEPASPPPTLLAAVPAAVLTAVAWGVERAVARRSRRLRLLPYFVAAWAAAALVSFPFVSTAFIGRLFLRAIGLFVVAAILVERFVPRGRSARRSLRTAIVGLAVATLLILYIGISGEASDVEHYELRTAQALRNGDTERAFQCGEKSLATSPRLFALRCYLIATATAEGLPGKIFEQPVPDSINASLPLLPDDRAQHLSFSPDSLYARLGATPRAGEDAVDYLERCVAQAMSHAENPRAARFAADYLLSALLIRRNLPRFAARLRQLYPKEIATGRLPRYYAQALVLYQHTQRDTTAQYHDANCEANYRDYADMKRSIVAAAERSPRLRRQYGETYWWWFDYGLSTKR